MSFRLWFDVGDGDNNYDGDDDDTEQDFLSKRQFTEEQQHQIRDIRRRGKNKVIKWDKFDKNRVKNTWKNGKTK